MKYILILALAFASCSDGGGPDDPGYLIQLQERPGMDKGNAEGIEVYDCEKNSMRPDSMLTPVNLAVR